MSSPKQSKSAPLADVVVVIIDADGTVSVVGPFLSTQRAKQYIASDPELAPENGVNAEQYRMTKP